MKVITLSLAFIFCSFIQAADFEYVGTNKCKSCHKSAKKGEQYVKWEASSHSKAFATLLTEKAVAIAKEMKLETAPHESAECLICHTVGFGSGGYEVQDEAFYNPADDDKKGKKAAKRMLNLQNVGCESCHGPGSKYKSKNKYLRELAKNFQRRFRQELIDFHRFKLTLCHQRMKQQTLLLRIELSV